MELMLGRSIQVQCSQNVIVWIDVGRINFAQVGGTVGPNFANQICVLPVKQVFAQILMDVWVDLNDGRDLLEENVQLRKTQQISGLATSYTRLQWFFENLIG